MEQFIQAIPLWGYAALGVALVLMILWSRIDSFSLSPFLPWIQITIKRKKNLNAVKPGLRQSVEADEQSHISDVALNADAETGLNVDQSVKAGKAGNIKKVRVNVRRP